MSKKKCFFIGHRDTPAEILPILEKVIEYHILEYGVTEFFVGNYGSFDHMAKKAVISAKKYYPEITLTLVLPYHPAKQPIEISKDFDSTYYPFDKTIPPRVAISRANKSMIDYTDYLIAYVWETASNARNVLEYAEKRAKKGLISVDNIATTLNLC